MKKSDFFIRIIITVILIFGLGACGKNETVSAPYGSEILVQPSTFEAFDGYSSVSWSDTYFTITVVDPFGQPKSNVEIFIDYPWSTPDAYSFVQLYSGDLDSGYTPEYAPMKAVTDKSGNFHLRIDFAHGAGLSYIGDIQIISASAIQGYIEVKVD